MCNRGTLKRYQGSWKKAWTLTSMIQTQEVSILFLLKKYPTLNLLKYSFFQPIFAILFGLSAYFYLSHKLGM